MVWRPWRAESSKEIEFEARVFLCHPDRRIVGLCRKKASPSVVPALNQPPPVPARTGQREGAFMKLNNLAKSVAKSVLGLAVLVATGALASNTNNKGSFHVSEAVEINGQQIPAGYYDLRWQGTGSNVELTLMQGNKEIAKTNARAGRTRKSLGDSVSTTASGAASVSQFRFAGKEARESPSTPQSRASMPRHGEQLNSHAEPKKGARMCSLFGFRLHSTFAPTDSDSAPAPHSNERYCRIHLDSFRSQSLKPAFFTTIVWSPSVTCTSDGVFPTKLPSTSMSALSGIEATDILPLD